MEQATKPDKTNKEKQGDGLKEIWDNPLGKIGIVALSIVGLTFFVGGMFKVGAYTMGAYKDFRDANRR